MYRLRIAHLARWLEVGGTEQVIYNLCKFGTQRQWVVGLQDGPMRVVLENAGIVAARLATTPAAQAAALADADVVNVHWLEHNPALLAPAIASQKPLVFTQHGLAVLPPLPGSIVCTSQSTLEIQNTVANAAWSFRMRSIAHASIHPNGGPMVWYASSACAGRWRCADYFWESIERVLAACPEAEVKIVGGERFGAVALQGIGDRHDVARQSADAHIFAYAPLPNEGTLDLVGPRSNGQRPAMRGQRCPVRGESVRHDAMGLVSPFGDVAALAEHLIRLVRDCRLRETLGRQGGRRHASVSISGSAYARTKRSIAVPTVKRCQSRWSKNHRPPRSRLLLERPLSECGVGTDMP